MSHSALLLILTTLIPGCMNTSVQYEYADGSANRYIITPTLLTYDPVKPEESSTGMYSGGEPAEVSLSKEEFEALQSLFDMAIANTAVHINDRIKTSGMITVITGTEPNHYILTPGCAEMIALEAKLKGFLNR
jgi:hypothetical protein